MTAFAGLEPPAWRDVTGLDSNGSHVDGRDHGDAGGEADTGAVPRAFEVDGHLVLDLAAEIVLQTAGQQGSHPTWRQPASSSTPVNHSRSP